MTYKLEIRDNKTDEIKTVDSNVEWGEGSMFWLTEGNMACDCNRGTWFYGEEDETECGEGRFTIISVIVPVDEKQV